VLALEIYTSGEEIWRKKCGQ